VTLRNRIKRLEAAQKRETVGAFPWDLDDLRAMEAEVEERQRAYAEESRRRDRELLKRNRALIGLPPLEGEE
jgi:cobyric acid synthase